MFLRLMPPGSWRTGGATPSAVRSTRAVTLPRKGRGQAKWIPTSWNAESSLEMQLDVVKAGALEI